MISLKSSIKLLLVPLESISELFKVPRTQDHADWIHTQRFHPSKIHGVTTITGLPKLIRGVGFKYLFISPLFGGFLKWWVSPTTMVFLLKMIILGCFGGTTIYGNTHLGKMNPF